MANFKIYDQVEVLEYGHVICQGTILPGGYYFNGHHIYLIHYDKQEQDIAHFHMSDDIRLIIIRKE